ncbi:MAG: hypothetical protein KME60_16640 [Cyanomargarita calcarea GSE-NOS-MK-12-04C]|uniref:Uncharacterized protein n=1 Tax=Cyanomargarita calcarea GSE-NOS-MK-12-04C TaxID=2839659 RepID=A0A951QP09_9CYAN|nr:hypothetical protein [Cyanomargarita calcarea GSE-NOS-MK-12-04C]
MCNVINSYLNELVMPTVMRLSRNQAIAYSTLLVSSHFLTLGYPIIPTGNVIPCLIAEFL